MEAWDSCGLFEVVACPLIDSILCKQNDPVLYGLSSDQLSRVCLMKRNKENDFTRLIHFYENKKLLDRSLFCSIFST